VITINGNDYDDNDPVTWEDAVAEGGFYYSRACYLGVERPPAILFDKDHRLYLAAMARYHELFRDAEAQAVDTIQDEEREMSLEAADQNLMIVTNRLRELADSVDPGSTVAVDADEMDALADMLSAARSCL
jgi:hypothetical protein